MSHFLATKSEYGDFFSVVEPVDAVLFKFLQMQNVFCFIKHYQG